MDRAHEAYRAGVEKIDAEFSQRLKKMRSRRLSKKSLSEKVRGEIAAGKLPKGVLGREVKRRWARNKRDHARKENKLQQDKAQQLQQLQQQIYPSGEPAPQFHVKQEAWNYTVEVEVEMSDDIRIINVSFEANAGDDFEALVFLACVDYFQTDTINIVDYSIVSQTPLDSSEE